MSGILYSVDVESTGVDLKNDRLIQLAFLKIDGESVETFNDFCYTDIEMNDTVTAVHRITNAMLEDKYWPFETDAFAELEKGNLPENYFISHGNTLDLTMLAHEELEIRMQKIDTDKCARLLLKDTDSYKLEDLITRYALTAKARALAKKIGLQDIDAHDALSDALWHYVLFTLLLDRVDGDIGRLVTMTAEPMLLEKISFGRHKGKSFKSVFNSDPLDLVWMYANMTDDWIDLEHTLGYWLRQKPYFWNKARKEKEDAALLKL